MAGVRKGTRSRCFPRNASLVKTAATSHCSGSSSLGTGSSTVSSSSSNLNGPSLSGDSPAGCGPSAAADEDHETPGKK